MGPIIQKQGSWQVDLIKADSPRGNQLKFSWVGLECCNPRLFPGTEKHILAKDISFTSPTKAGCCGGGKMARFRS